MYVVIPGRTKHEPGIHQATRSAAAWIPGSRQEARPGMTKRDVGHHAGAATVRAAGTGLNVIMIRNAPSPMAQEPT